MAGPTGYIGRRLTQRLLDKANIDVRLLVRNKNKVQAAIVDKVDIWEGSTFEVDSLKDALKGVETGYYLIHSMGTTEIIYARNFR